MSWNSKLTEGQRKQLVKDYISNSEIITNQLGRGYGVSGSAVRRLLKSQNVEIRKKKSYKKEIIKLYKNGKFLKKILDELNNVIDSRVAVKPHKSIFSIGFCGNRQNCLILKALYSKATTDICLERKLIKVRKFVSRYVGNSIGNNWVNSENPEMGILSQASEG